MIHTPFTIGDLTLPHRLIQGPLAGYSCAAFRSLFYDYTAPAYCVTEMISALDIVKGKHSDTSRYLYRAPEETRLAYQISGKDPVILAEAACILAEKNADIIDINCGCPKPKIRKKGAGSSLLENPDHLFKIVQQIKAVLRIPLTIKIRIQDPQKDIYLTKLLEQAGADAIIVHGRRWIDDYDIRCNLQSLEAIKQNLTIPVIANGDIQDRKTLEKTLQTGCDAYMIARAGTGKPWLYKSLLENRELVIPLAEREHMFAKHMQGLIQLDGEHRALLQAQKLIKYYDLGI